MMRAVTFDRFGGPEVLAVSERPAPRPGPGEVCVRVAASTVNPTDLMMRDGRQAAMMRDLAPPFIPGMEFSGRVHQAGEGVAMAPGTPVIGVVNPRRPQGGAHAELVCVSARSVAALDGAVDLIAAATVPMNALTARMALELMALEPGRSVLVTGGTGMLGGSAIQLARQDGLRVVANGREEDADLLRALGAELVVPRGEGLVEAVLARFEEGVDGLIDGALIGGEISRVVRSGGTAVSLRRSHPIEDPRLHTTYVSVIEGMERQDILQAIAAALARGTLKPQVAEGGIYPFTEAAAAHERAGGGRLRGRIVLRFSD